MANRVADCGVPRANPADINAIPVVTDVGTHGGITFVAPANSRLGPINQHQTRYPSTTETADTLGVGVPLSPVSGLITG